MLSQSNMFVAALVGLCGVVLIGASNPYAPTYNDAGSSSYEPQPAYHQPAQSYHPQPAASSYKPASSYQQPSAYPAAASSYEPPASYHHQPAPSYHHAAPSYPKYTAPSSAHHTQYDNYYPKQSYSKPMYAPKPMYSPPAPAYYQPPQPQYAPPKPAYHAAQSYGASSSSHHDMEDYKAKA